MPSIIVLSSELTIIESIVVSSQCEKLLRYDRESVSLATKFPKVGRSCVHPDMACKIRELK